MNRRELLGALAATPFVDGGSAPAGPRAMKPLPFDPAKLKGLSEKLLTSHHENNYGGAFKNLGKVRDELARVTKDTPGFVLSGLRERALQFANSVTMHEAYFGNLGGDGKVPAAFARFEEPLRASALSQAGGTGWTTLSLALDSGELGVWWHGNHMQSLAGAVPLLVLDMYEHSYAIDYGAAAAKYVDAFFVNAKWDEVERRHERALTWSRPK